MLQRTLPRLPTTVVIINLEHTRRAERSTGMLLTVEQVKFPSCLHPIRAHPTGIRRRNCLLVLIVKRVETPNLVAEAGPRQCHAVVEGGRAEMRDVRRRHGSRDRDRLFDPPPGGRPQAAGNRDCAAATLNVRAGVAR